MPERTLDGGGIPGPTVDTQTAADRAPAVDSSDAADAALGGIKTGLEHNTTASERIWIRFIVFNLDAQGSTKVAPGYGLPVGEGDGAGEGEGDAPGEPVGKGLALGDGEGSGGQPVPPGASSTVCSTPTMSKSCVW